MNKILITLLSLATTLSVLAAEGFSSVEEQMTGKEFNAAGLNKLSQQELDALNDWLRRHSVATLAARSTNAGAVPADNEQNSSKSENNEKDGERSTITSNLVGSFSGWDGQTTFKLENGMIWVQADKDKFYTKEIENPTVIIKPGLFGTWRLRLDGFNSECKVKRIQ